MNNDKRSVKMICNILMYTVLFFFLSACSTWKEPTITSTALPLPPGVTNIDSIEISTTGKVLLTANTSDLWIGAPDYSSWQKITLPLDANCLATYYYSLLVISDDRIAFIKNCTGTWHDHNHRAFHEKPFLAFFKLQSNIVTLDYEIELPGFGFLSLRNKTVDGILSTSDIFGTL